MAKLLPERLIALEPFWGVWRLSEAIGEGSYGKVFKIVRKEFGNEYVAALKWICLPQQEAEINSMRSEMMTDDDIRTYYDGLIHSLQNEILLMSSLGGNSHIVNYADHTIAPRQGEIGWDVLIRMELLTPLDSYVKNNPFSEADVAMVGWHICQALALCAQHRVLHRDIKPDNIFISPDGNYKLGDFGVSRTLETTRGNLSRKGTPMYMSPEIYFNREAGYSSDVYSLGIVLYRLLNKQRMPFLPVNSLPTHNDRETAFARRIKGEMLPSPTMGCRELQRIVLKACAYNPKQRYQSAEEMAEQLERLIKKGRLSNENMYSEQDNIRISQMNSNRSSLHPSRDGSDIDPEIPVTQDPTPPASPLPARPAKPQLDENPPTGGTVGLFGKPGLKGGENGGKKRDEADDTEQTAAQTARKVREKRKKKGPSLIAIAAVIVAVAAGAVYFAGTLFPFGKTPQITPAPVAKLADVTPKPQEPTASAPVAEPPASDEASRVSITGMWRVTSASKDMILDLRDLEHAGMTIETGGSTQTFNGVCQFDGANMRMAVTTEGDPDAGVSIITGEYDAGEDTLIVQTGSASIAFIRQGEENADLP